MRWCWVNFQYRSVLLIWIIVGQGPTVLAVGAGGGAGCLDIFSLIYHFSFLSPYLWETARYRLIYCLKGPLSPKTTNQLKLGTLTVNVGKETPPGFFSCAWLQCMAPLLKHQTISFPTELMGNVSARNGLCKQLKSSYVS